MCTDTLYTLSPVATTLNKSGYIPDNLLCPAQVLIIVDKKIKYMN